MDKKYYLHRNQIITGPFDRAELMAMYKKGLLNDQDRFSTDKIHVADFCEMLNIIVPETASYREEQQQPSSAEEPAVQEPRAESVEPPPRLISGIVTAEPYRVINIVSDTVMTMFSNSSTLGKLSVPKYAVMSTSAVTAIFTALLLTTASWIFFAHYYNYPPRLILARGIIGVITSGTIAFIGCKLAGLFVRKPNDIPNSEWTFMTAAHCMMHTGALLIAVNGVMFLINTQLFEFNLLRLCIAGTIAALPAIFCLHNTFQTLRHNFCHCQGLSPAAAEFAAEAAIWLNSFVFTAIQSPMYKL